MEQQSLPNQPVASPEAEYQRSADLQQGGDGEKIGMPLRTKLFILVLALIAAGVGYLKFTYEPAAPEPQVALTATPEPTPEPTPEDIVKLIAAPYEVDAQDAASESAQLKFIRENKPGMVVLFGSRIASSAAELVIQQIEIAYSDVDYKPIIAVDHEGGTVQRLSGTGFTRLPSWQVLCHQERERRLEQMLSSAEELAAVGVDMVFAPVLDLGSAGTPLGTRICSNDPSLTAAAARDYVNAFLKAGITPVVKHYPGIGTTTRDLHDSPDVVTGTQEQSLFNAVLSISQNMGVMTAHVLVEQVAEDKPCSLSAGCVYPLTVDHPQSLILADALEMDAARFEADDLVNPRPLPAVAEDAVLAGNHVLLFGPDVTMEELSTVVEHLKTRYTENVDVRSSMQASLEQIQRFSTRYEQQSETTGN